MACTKETYTATATWTASQLADIFRDAFIDAGLMASWFDSFLSGSVENRILKVEYDNTKTYGTTYYWWMFTTGGVFLHVATGWNATTHVPTGTQYLDYFSATTSSVHNWQMFGPSTSNTVELVRYTSGVDVDQSWFVVKSSTIRQVFAIVHPAKTVQPWMDLNKGFFAGFGYINCSIGTVGSNRRHGVVNIVRGPGLRRDLISGASLNGSTSVGEFGGLHARLAILGYGAVGNQSGAFSSNATIAYDFLTAGRNSDEARVGSIILPSNFSGTNPAFASNSNPVFHSMPFMPYITDPLPADFGLTFHYATNSFSPGDTFVVNAGTEEWEVLDFAANSSAVTGASPLFLARMV